MPFVASKALAKATLILGLVALDSGISEGRAQVAGDPLRPPPLSSHVMTYHDALQQVVLFGGSRPDRSYSDALWGWRGEQWVLLAAGGPAPRIHASMAYDNKRDRLVLHGGIESRRASFADTWEWDGNSWTRVDDGTAESPGTRDHHAMAFDAARGVCVLFGGQNQEDEYQADTWEWDGSTWKRVVTSGPPVRGTHRMVYDPDRRAVVLATGWGPDGQWNDAWAWNGRQWAALTEDDATPAPAARGASRIAYLQHSNQLLLFGGYVGRQADDQTWVLDAKGWRHLQVPAPSARNVHGLAYDPLRRVAVLYGGMAAGTRSNDTWEWDGEAWRCVIEAEPTTLQRARALIADASEAGYVQGDMAACVRLLRESEQLQPDNLEVHIRLAKAWVTLGDLDAASDAIKKAWSIDPLSGGAAFARSQVQWLRRHNEDALRTLRTAIDNPETTMGRGDRGSLSLSLVALLMHAGDFEGAAAFLESQRPDLKTLHEEPQPTTVAEIGRGWHGVGAYAHVQRALGNEQQAAALLARFTPYDEASVEQRNEGPATGIDHWNLAATGAGRISNEAAIEHLKKAVDGGFLLSWRYNFALHPTLWPLRDDPRFQDLLTRMEITMQQQQQAIGQP